MFSSRFATLKNKRHSFHEFHTCDKLSKHSFYAALALVEWYRGADQSICQELKNEPYFSWEATTGAKIIKHSVFWDVWVTQQLLAGVNTDGGFTHGRKKSRFTSILNNEATCLTFLIGSIQKDFELFEIRKLLIDGLPWNNALWFGTSQLDNLWP